MDYSISLCFFCMISLTIWAFIYWVSWGLLLDLSWYEGLLWLRASLSSLPYFCPSFKIKTLLFLEICWGAGKTNWWFSYSLSYILGTPICCFSWRNSDTHDCCQSYFSAHGSPFLHFFTLLWLINKIIPHLQLLSITSWHAYMKITESAFGSRFLTLATSRSSTSSCDRSWLSACFGIQARFGGIRFLLLSIDLLGRYCRDFLGVFRGSLFAALSFTISLELFKLAQAWWLLFL